MVSDQVGNLLLEAGIINQQLLDAALLRQRTEGGRLESNCLKLGFADEASLARVLSLQIGVPFVVLSRSAIPLHLLGSLDLEQARRLNALPVHRDAGRLVVAMADPHDSRLVDELRFVTGEELVEHGALIGPLQESIEQAYQLIAGRQDAFFKGIDLDLSIKLGTVGHAEIVLGRESDTADPSYPTTSESLPTVPPALETKLPLKGEATTVLVVDDDDALRSMLVEFMNKSGYRTWEAADGRQAMKLLQNNLPDVILLDAMLPVVHGFDICRRVKNAESTQHIPVIMISAVYRGEEYRDRVRLHYGANAYIEKPLKLSNLKQVVESCLAARESKAKPEDLSARTRSLIQQADQAEAAGDLTAVVNHLTRVIRTAPFFASVHCRLAQVYEKLGQSYRAISQFEQAAELNQNYPILFHLARIYEKTGFMGKASETWNQCLLICKHPEDAESIRSHLEKLKE